MDPTCPAFSLLGGRSRRLHHGGPKAQRQQRSSQEALRREPSTLYRSSLWSRAQAAFELPEKPASSQLAGRSIRSSGLFVVEKGFGGRISVKHILG